MLRDKMFLTAVCIVFFTIFAVFTAPWLLPHPLLQQYDKTLLPSHFIKGICLVPTILAETYYLVLCTVLPALLRLRLFLQVLQ